MKRIKVSFKHKVGNMIGGLCSIADGLVVFLTFGNYNSKFQLDWNIRRRSTGVLCDDKIGK